MKTLKPVLILSAALAMSSVAAFADDKPAPAKDAPVVTAPANGVSAKDPTENCVTAASRASDGAGDNTRVDGKGDSKAGGAK